MKIKVGKTYRDGVGCTVRIIGRIKAKRSFIGVIDWSTCKDEKSRDVGPEVETYDERGLCFPGLAYRLVREIKRKPKEKA